MCLAFGWNSNSFSFLNVAQNQADVVKGDFNEAMSDWFMSNKREVPFTWTGETEDDFGLCLNGFKFVP